MRRNPYYPESGRLGIQWYFNITYTGSIPVFWGLYVSKLARARSVMPTQEQDDTCVSWQRRSVALLVRGYSILTISYAIGRRGRAYMIQVSIYFFKNIMTKKQQTYINYFIKQYKEWKIGLELLTQSLELSERMFENKTKWTDYVCLMIKKSDLPKYDIYQKITQ